MFSWKIWKQLKSNQTKIRFVPNDNHAQHRIRLIQEECKELCDALEGESADHVLKEICDVLYVVFGTAQCYNWPVDDAFKLVHENNMLKITYPTDKFGKYIKPKDHPQVDLTPYMNKDNKQEAFHFWGID